MDTINYFVNDADPTLTRCERGYLPLLAQGLKRKEIALELNRELCTVNTHVMHIQQKLGVPNSAAAVSMAIARGILSVSLVLVLVCISPGLSDVNKARLVRYSRYRARELWIG